jgi:hypothetical protein
MADSAVLTVTISTRISDSAVSLIRIVTSSYAATSQDELLFVMCANMNVPSQVKRRPFVFLFFSVALRTKQLFISAVQRGILKTFYHIHYLY